MSLIEGPLWLSKHTLIIQKTMKTSKQTFVTPVGEVTYLTLTNARGSQVTLSSLGAGIIAIRVPDREGNMADVVIGYPEAADYIADGPCAGKTPGPVSYTHLTLPTIGG